MSNQTRPKVSEVDPQRWPIGRDIKTGRQTDRYTRNDLEIVQKYPGNVSIKFQTYISSRTEDISILAKFQWGSKPTNRLTDIQEIWNDL